MNSLAVHLGTGSRGALRRLAGAMLGAALALAAAAGPAAPAAAAGTTVYVDDTAANNGSTSCPATATITSNLASLTITSGETLYICPGVYTGPITFSGLSGVKIIGKGSPTIRAVAGQDHIIKAISSTGVTVQGLVLDGSLSFDPTYAYGIVFDTSSGTITNNYLVRIRETAMTSNCYGEGIVVFDAPGAVKILKNTVYDFECVGIDVSHANGAVIQSNLVWATAASGSKPLGISVDKSSKVTVSKNTASSDWNYLSANQSVGIHFQHSPYAKITANKINAQSSAITLTTYCPAAGLTLDHAVISGNIAMGLHDGIQIYATTTSTSACDGTANAISIKSNKFFADLPVTSGWAVSTYTNDASATFDPHISGLILSGNQFSMLEDFYHANPNPGIDPPSVNTKNVRVLPPLGS